MTVQTPSPAEPVSTSDLRSEVQAGLVAVMPIMVAMVPIALLLGALGAQKGISALEMALMSLLVFAGGSQFVAVELWAQPTPWIALGFSALLVNVRHILLGMSLGRKLRSMSFGKVAVLAYFMTDETWALSEHRARRLPISFAFFMGASIPLYLGWGLVTTTGAALGAQLRDLDPAQYGADFVFPALFIGLILSFWSGMRTGAVLAASALAAVLCKLAFGGAFYVAAGALAGVATAALLYRPSDEEQSNV